MANRLELLCGVFGSGHLHPLESLGVRSYTRASGRGVLTRTMENRYS